MRRMCTASCTVLCFRYVSARRSLQILEVVVRCTACSSHVHKDLQCAHSSAPLPRSKMNLSPLPSSMRKPDATWMYNMGGCVYQCRRHAIMWVYGHLGGRRMHGKHHACAHKHHHAIMHCPGCDDFLICTFKSTPRTWCLRTSGDPEPSVVTRIARQGTTCFPGNTKLPSMVPADTMLLSRSVKSAAKGMFVCHIPNEC